MFSPLDVVVGLNKTKQVVRESVEVVNVCAVVYSPNEMNPSSVAFPFDVHFHFNGPRDSTSKNLYTSHTKYRYHIRPVLVSLNFQHLLLTFMLSLPM